MLIYFFMTTLAVVVAPISTMPLLPIAATAWGPFLTAIISIFAWFSGSIIAFLLARHIGHPILQKFVDMSRIESIVNKISKKHIFWNITLLRMIIPVDILSYAIGLATKIPFTTYAIASFIGILPMAFLLSYAITFPLWITALTIFIIYLLSYFIAVKYRKK